MPVPFIVFNFALVNSNEGAHPLSFYQTNKKYGKTIEERVYELEQLLFTNKNVLSFDEASKFLNLSKSYLYKLTSGNLIPHYKPQGKMLYFEKAELEAWLRQNPIKTSAQIAQEAQRYIMGSKSLMQK
ncbi:DNA binding domain, excisionase family [Segatella oris F0302]|uniref:DNA binding domain, excisionase family n=1 Tax=Segatella oris F0302 TaxID=649760 RepID=D1QVM9_9BACT|nr:DNA binding domain, excisionase family [Segatella oris F0302]